MVRWNEEIKNEATTNETLHSRWSKMVLSTKKKKIFFLFPSEKKK